jgi:hypothetical protein
MRKITVITILVLVCIVAAWFFVRAGDSFRLRAEREHGIKLPLLAHDIQCRGDAWHGFLDRGAATIFEMHTNDLPQFMAQLQIRSRRTPARVTGDPTMNGWNVWPEGSSTFVPGDDQYSGFERTWQGQATPIEMLSCSSSKGDWLHVELWRLESGSLVVKMFTDWN